ELNGKRMSVVQMLPDGSRKKTEKELKSEAEARSASDRMARELVSRGFVEQGARTPKPAPARSAAPASKQAATALPAEFEEINAGYLLEAVEEPVAAAALVLQRLSPAPGASVSTSTETAPKKKKKGGKKKKKKGESGEALDKRVLASIGA